MIEPKQGYTYEEGVQILSADTLGLRNDLGGCHDTTAG